MDRESQLTEPRGPHAIGACAPTQTPTVMALFIGSILAVMLFVLPAFGQTAGQPITENASAKRYQPWTCARGYFEQAGLCDAVSISANAYFDDATYGTGWKCDRGYAASAETCEFISVPEYGHLDRSGNRWECRKNFQKSEGLCVLNNQARATAPSPFKMHM